MFCPNCGNNCGDAKFCPECGRKLRTNTEVSATETIKAKPPAGKYEGTFGYVEISMEHLTVHKKILFRTVERTIAYQDIVNVAYKKAVGLGTGYLAIRERKDRLLPIATSQNAASDETALCFGENVSNAFYSIYQYLETFVDPNAVEPFAEAPKVAQAKEDASKTVSQSGGKTVIPHSTYKAKSKLDIRNEKKQELEKSGQVYCPKCLSTSVTANKKGFGIGKAVVGAAALGGIGLAAGNIGAKKVICTCLKCGYQWKAGKK